MMAAPDYKAVLDFAIKLAREAGDLIAASSTARRSSHPNASADASKKNRVDRQGFTVARLYLLTKGVVCSGDGNGRSR